MYKIMIIDDEPPIIRYLTKLITDCCPGFTVDGTADNGAAALEKMNQVMPDVVLTDVKMPVLDGITLVKRLESDYPEAYAVIISGYQDFEYAREAIKSGVVDYLPKPADPEQLKELFVNLAARLDRDYRCAALKLLAGAVSGLPLDDRLAGKYLNYRSFALFLLRKGALPARVLNKPWDMEELCFFSDWNAAELEKLLAVDRAWLIAGRDESELLIVAGMNQKADRLAWRKAAEAILRLGDGHGFYTLAYSATPFALSSMAEKAECLFDTINQLTVIGKNQILDDTSLSRIQVQDPPLLDSSFEKKLEFLINSRSLRHLHDELANLFQEWESQGRTQLWMEKIIRQIFSAVEKPKVDFSADLSLNLEKQLNEAFLHAPDFDGLFKYIWEMIEETFSPVHPDCAAKKNAPLGLFERVEAYIMTHLAEPLTLQGVCETMGVSQPYLSRLFRKYKEMSFCEYINEVRINKAKRLMAAHPEMLFKEIAAIVGYNDPYYFSRIFKAVTGRAPSEFKTGGALRTT